ncbi:MAG: hypothetical protein J6D08_18155 [Lachnospiraceae bacterium]|nr:hypothetical protein [Lachnospiraceae bacterium]
MGKRKETDYEAELIREYEHWEYLKEYGGSDPFYDDATNMNLTRNHIMYAKKQLEDLYGRDMSKYPEVYFRELPPVTEKGYMAGAAEIRDRAVEVLDTYLADANFQFLLCNRDMLGKKEAEKISIDNVLGYVCGLARALKEDDLITMRSHMKNPDGYRESFAQCAERVKQILSEKRKEPSAQTQGCQMTLFQVGLEAGRCR